MSEYKYYDLEMQVGDEILDRYVACIDPKTSRIVEALSFPNTDVNREDYNELVASREKGTFTLNLTGLQNKMLNSVLGVPEAQVTAREINEREWKRALIQHNKNSSYTKKESPREYEDIEPQDIIVLNIAGPIKHQKYPYQNMDFNSAREFLRATRGKTKPKYNQPQNQPIDFMRIRASQEK